jgi:hypothetical protein
MKKKAFDAKWCLFSKKLPKPYKQQKKNCVKFCTNASSSFFGKMEYFVVRIFLILKGKKKAKK